MTANDLKFGELNPSGEKVPYKYSDSWAIEQTTGPKRLVIGPSAHHIGLLQELCGEMEEPFVLLYVLVVPRSDDEPGRYQSPFPASRKDVLSFLNRFERFIESDGRHHLWLKSLEGSDLLVYDRHNLIYAYGELDRFREVLTAKGLTETPQIKIPSPHVHWYHQQYDTEYRQLLAYWNWQHSPLHDQDSE